MVVNIYILVMNPWCTHCRGKIPKNHYLHLKLMISQQSFHEENINYLSDKMSAQEDGTFLLAKPRQHKSGCNPSMFTIIYKTKGKVEIEEYITMMYYYNGDDEYNHLITNFEDMSQHPTSCEQFCCGCLLNRKNNQLKTPIKRTRPISLKLAAMAEFLHNKQSTDLKNELLPETVKEDMNRYLTHINSKQPDFNFQCNHGNP